MPLRQGVSGHLGHQQLGRSSVVSGAKSSIWTFPSTFDYIKKTPIFKVFGSSFLDTSTFVLLQTLIQLELSEDNEAGRVATITK